MLTLNKKNGKDTGKQKTQDLNRHYVMVITRKNMMCHCLINTNSLANKGNKNSNIMNVVTGTSLFHRCISAIKISVTRQRHTKKKQTPDVSLISTLFYVV